MTNPPSNNGPDGYLTVAEWHQAHGRNAIENDLVARVEEAEAKVKELEGQLRGCAVVQVAEPDWRSIAPGAYLHWRRCQLCSAESDQSDDADECYPLTHKTSCLLAPDQSEETKS